MATRMQQRRGTAAQWVSTNSGNGPILNAGEIGFETDTNKFKIGDGTNHWINLDYFIDANSTVNPAFGSSIVFEGATANAFETTVQVTDPTADRILTLPDSTGTIATQEYVDSAAANATFDSASAAGTGLDWNASTDQFNIDSTVTTNDGVQTLTNKTLTSPTITGATFNDSSIIFEGSSADAHETTLTVTNPTADRTITFPDATGTLVLSDGSGNLAVSGNLTVNGATTYLVSNELVITDKNIILAATEFPTNITASGGGITVKGTTDKTFSYNDSSDTWSSSESLNLPSGKSYKINGVNLGAFSETLSNKTISSSDNTISIAPSNISGVTVTATQINYLTGVTSAIQTQITDKAPLASPSFTGDVVLPSTTSIGDVSSIEIGYVNGVTSAIQTQLNNKQAVVANVSDTEIGYLDGVTSSIQTQLDDKSTASKTETLTNKTLTSPVINTPTGITSSDVGLGSVNNTSDADKPVSTATQTALDLKANLSGATFTGAITLHADPSSSLHAATKQYVDNTASGIIAKPQVLGATTANIDATYSNGTAGVGATLTHNTNGAFPAEAGGASGWAVGKGILVKNQTNKAQNGRYFISNMGSASTPYVLTRCGYCDEASEIPGAYIFVQDGTNAGTGWIQVVADPTTFVVGTDNIDVYQFSGSGTITAGTNISVSGNEVSVVATPSLSGVAFSDGTQTTEGVPSRTPIIQKTASYTLSELTERDDLIEMSSSSAITLSIPTDATLNYPIGTSIDILQTGTGQVTIAAVTPGTTTVNATPGLKLRTTWSSATLFKRAANTWVVFGDLTA